MASGPCYVDLLIIHPAWDAPVHGTLGGHRIRITDDDEWRLFQKGDLHVELFRHSLRWNVAVARPNDVLDIQTVPSIPRSDLKILKILDSHKFATITGKL